MRPSTSSMTASIIGCEALSSLRSRQVSSQCSIHGRRPVAGVSAVRRRPSPGTLAVRFMPGNIGPARRTLSRDVRSPRTVDGRAARAPLRRGYRSRVDITPDCSASATSRERFWFCGSCSIPKRREQRPQVRLHRVDAEEQLGGDLLVRRRRRELVVLVRARERDEHLALGRRQVGEHRRSPATCVGHRVLGLGAAVGDHGLPDAQRRRRRAAGAARDARAVDERAVAREAVVADRPLARDLLELGVQPRDLGVPRAGAARCPGRARR